jgi:hypothetical protein
MSSDRDEPVRTPEQPSKPDKNVGWRPPKDEQARRTSLPAWTVVAIRLRLQRNGRRDCESPERAQEIAASIPDARFAAVEVHPIMETSGQEM